MSSLLNACKLASGNVGSKIDLLPHNQMLYDKIVNEIENGERSIFYSQATGLGKSFIFMRLVQDYFMDKKILYIVPKIAIWNNLINYSDFNKLNKDNIEMATYTSFNKYDASLVDKYDVIFADECHHMLSNIQGNNIRKCFGDMLNKGKYVFGMTATPFYAGQYVDEICFKVSCYGLDVCEAIEAGILPKIKLALANIDFNEVPYDLKVKYSISGTEPLIKRLLREHSDITRWLVYFPTTKELECSYEEIKELFPDYEIFKVYTGLDDEFDVIKKFQESGRRAVLLSVNKLLEGIHLSNVGGVLLYRNVCEFSTYMQIYGRLCNINYHTTPVFLDIANSIIQITRVNEFKSSRYTGPRKDFTRKDLFDIEASDYWTIELADLLSNKLTNTVEYRGITFSSRNELAQLLNVPVYNINNFIGNRRGIAIELVLKEYVDYVLKESTYEEYIQDNYTGYYKACGLKFRDYEHLREILNTSVSYTAYTVQINNQKHKPSIEEYINHFSHRDDKIIYRGVDMSSGASVARHFGLSHSRPTSWVLENPGKTLQDFIDIQLEKREVYRGVCIGTNRSISEYFNISESFIESSSSSKKEIVDYMLDCFNTKYRGILLLYPEDNRRALHLTSTQWAELNGSDIKSQLEIIDTVYSWMYRGVLLINKLIVKEQLNISNKFIYTRINKGKSLKDIVDDAYVYMLSKEEISEEEYLLEIEKRRKQLGFE